LGTGIVVIALGCFMGTSARVRVAIVRCTRIAIGASLGRVFAFPCDRIAEVDRAVITVIALFRCEVAFFGDRVTRVGCTVVSVVAGFDVIVASAQPSITGVCCAGVTVVALRIGRAAFVFTTRQRAIQLTDATDELIARIDGTHFPVAAIQLCVETAVVSRALRIAAVLGARGPILAIEGVVYTFTRSADTGITGTGVAIRTCFGGVGAATRFTGVFCA